MTHSYFAAVVLPILFLLTSCLRTGISLMSVVTIHCDKAQERTEVASGFGFVQGSSWHPVIPTDALGPAKRPFFDTFP